MSVVRLCDREQRVELLCPMSFWKIYHPSFPCECQWGLKEAEIWCLASISNPSILKTGKRAQEKYCSLLCSYTIRLEDFEARSIEELQTPNPLLLAVNILREKGTSPSCKKSNYKLNMDWNRMKQFLISTSSRGNLDIVYWTICKLTWQPEPDFQAATNHIRFCMLFKLLLKYRNFDHWSRPMDP